jgi:hypothetical protein
MERKKRKGFGPLSHSCHALKVLKTSHEAPSLKGFPLLIMSPWEPCHVHFGDSLPPNYSLTALKIFRNTGHLHCSMPLLGFSFYSTGAWTQDLHLEPLHQPFLCVCDGCFKIGSLELFALIGFKPRSSWSPELLGLQAWATGARHF